MRVWMLSCLLLLRCGDASPPPVSAPPSSSTSSEAPPPPAEAAEAAPAPSASPSIESCEGLARWCGGWTGCVHVRERRDPDGSIHYDGLDAVSGHSYAPDARCALGEPCDDMCDPASGLCRPGVLEEIPVACSRGGGPTRAPFYCELAEGRCVQHDLPPAALPVGGRS